MNIKWLLRMGYVIYHVMNSSYRKFIIVCLILTVLIDSISGQHNFLKFQSLQEGLSNQFIKCIIKDSKGYMWFGTGEGLNKFDGTHITIYEYNAADTNSILSNNITFFYEDKKGKLYIGTSKGLCTYNREKDNFEIVKYFNRNLSLYVTSLVEDNNNNLWIGAAGIGLFRYNHNEDRLYSYLNDPKNASSISSNFINTIFKDYKNRIWIGTRSGLDQYNPATNSFIRFNSLLLNDSPEIYIKQLVNDQDQNLWVGTFGKGLYMLIEKDKNWYSKQYIASGKQGNLSQNTILSLLNDKRGNVWVGTENGGLNIIRPGSNEFIAYKSEEGNPKSLNSNSIWSLYQDNTGIIWIGNYNHGLNYVDERIKKFEVYQRNPFQPKSLLNNNVTAFSEDPYGNLWIATDGAGISCFNLKLRSFTNTFNNNSLSSKAILAVLNDSKQRIWAGTWAGGIDLFDKRGKFIKNFRFGTNNTPGNTFVLYEDRLGNIWAGTAGNGLLLYDNINQKFLSVVDKNSSTHLSNLAFINTFFQDTDGTYWIGLPYCLIRMKYVNGKREFTQYRPSNNPKSISSSIILTIFEDSKRNLWIGTDNGLNLVNKRDGTFTVYKKENGLPNNTIRGILEDNQHCLWISTNNGISKFDVAHNSFKNYTKDDGLVSNNFYSRSCLKTRAGEFFFGSNHGIVSFFPDSIKMNDYIPPVYFTGLKIFNNPVIIGAEDSPLSKSISETKSITLTHKQTSFTIEFAALNFTNASKNQYEYMLEGFESNWVSSGTKNYASYTNINAGKYTFKVKGSNNEGVWNPEPIQLEIIVLPPFWKTTWAYLLYSIIITTILWGFIKLLIIKANQAEKLRLEKIHHEKSEELNRMKVQFFANISHEFRTPLSLILPPLKQIIDDASVKADMKKNLEMIFRNANKLFGLINELMDFTKSEEGKLKMMVQKVDMVQFAREVFGLFSEEANRRNINYRFETEWESIEAWIDKSKMEKIFSNLLSNAFKFTIDNGNITFKINKDNSSNPTFIEISVIDNGSGISEEYISKIFDRFYQSPDKENKHVAGTGIGLALTKSLVELHHGTITVTSQKWKETCFTIKIQSGKNHFNKNEILDEEEGLPIVSETSLLEESNKEQIKPDKNAPLLLIVEDNMELREYLVNILSSKFQILQAADGAEGLKIAQEAIPDLILSDIVMPRLSGTDLCKAVKAEMATSHIPVILLTSKASTPEIIEGIEYGADAYITKPFDISHLKVTIEKTIENRRKLYQRFSQDIYLMPKENSENELDRKFLEKIIDYIDKNVTDSNISVETLANHMLMSRTNVYRKIKSITGQTATEFIKTIRLKMAIKLLESGKYNISEIAFSLGFTSPGYFAKCFKDQYGKSPSEFLETKNKNI